MLRRRFAMPKLSKEYLEENYIRLGKTRYQISEETGVDPSSIGSMLQCFGIKRYSTKRHGLCRHPLNTIWCGMKERCQNPNASNYRWYGGNNITLCDEWKEFKPFYDWAISNGWREGLSIDRIDGSKGYSPDNCRFVTHVDQCRNRRSNVPMTVDGETHIQCEWEELLAIPKKTIAKWKNRYGYDEAVRRIAEKRAERIS